MAKPTRTARKLYSAMQELDLADRTQLSNGNHTPELIATPPKKLAGDIREIARQINRSITDRTTFGDVVKIAEESASRSVSRIATVESQLSRVESAQALSGMASDPASASKMEAMIKSLEDRVLRTADVAASYALNASDALRIAHRNKIAIANLTDSQVTLVKCLYMALSGRTEWGAPDENVTKAFLDGAAAGDGYTEFTVNVLADVIVDGVVKTIAYPEFSFLPKYTIGGTFSDGDIGLPILESSLGVMSVLTGTWTWDGTTTVTFTGEDISEYKLGDAIRLNSNGQLFELGSIGAGTGTILNPHGYTIPTGATGSSVGVMPYLINGIASVRYVWDTDAGSTKVFEAADFGTLQIDSGTEVPMKNFSKVKTLTVV